MDFGCWPFHKICWVAMGRGQLEYPGGAAALGQDDFLLLPAGWVHRFVDAPGKPLTLVILCLSESFIDGGSFDSLKALWQSSRQQMPEDRASRARTAFHRHSLVENFRLALREQGNRAKGWEAALQALAVRVILSCSRGYAVPGPVSAKSVAKRAVEGAVAYIETHVYESLQVGDLAERCGISPRRFSDLFKQCTGRTFDDYLNRKRVEYACRRLKETGHILYACHESGFSDPAYFYRVFKRVTGQTPGDYLTTTAAGSNHHPP